MTLPAGIDREVLLFLERHETRVHALPGREIRELGDGWVLFDPMDREPFWNRAAGLTWPAEPAAFDARLAQTIALFGVLDRIPHVWPRPVLNEPPDLVDRLIANGWENVGGGWLMVLTDPEPARAAVRRRRLPAGVTLERLGHERDGHSREAAADVARVLAEAFAVEAERQTSLELETLAMWDRPFTEAYVVRVDGEAAAVAKLTTLEGASYLSSIGTRPAYRGRGLGRLVTAAAAADAADAGSRWTYLGVWEGNDPAVRMYRRLGFEPVGDPVPDLLLR
jgi:ribosomal protein S18 acetylase RimI-like enzyme